MVDLPDPDDAESALPPGPRRSTYTPPPPGAAYLPGSLTDDSASPTTPARSPEPDAASEPDAAPEPGAAPAPEEAPGPKEAPASSPQVDAQRDDPERVVWEVRAAGPGDAESAPASQPMWEPGPAASPAVAPARPADGGSASAAAEIPGVPPPPQRASLSDADLAAVVDPASAAPGSTAELLDLFEEQLTLRAEEARRLSLWERAVRESGIADADEIVESVRSGFTGIIDVIPTADRPGDPWGRYPGETAPPAPAPDDRGPIVIPLIAPPPEAASAPPPAIPPSTADLDAVLAQAPPPFGLIPSAAVPPPIDDAAFALTPEAPGVEPAEAAVIESAPGTWSLAAESLTGPIGPDRPLVPAVEQPSSAASGSMQTIPVADTDAPITPSPLRVEASALEPTPVALRAGRSIRLFWLWFAVNASVVSIGLGAVLAALGMSLRQAILSALIGVAASFLPLGLGTLAGKWSGQPTMVVSRATFGIVGNLLPAVLAIVTRLLWAAVLLGMLGAGVAEALRSSGIAAGADPLGLASIIATVALAIAAAVAGFGYGMIAIVSAVASVLAGILVVLVIVSTAGAVDLDTALAIPDGDWMLVVTGAVLVFSAVGLAWANSSGDLARYQSKDSVGASAVLFASSGATLPAFALIAWGAVLAASDPAAAVALSTNPVGALAGLLPAGFGLPLVLAVATSLLAAAALALYSGGFALLAAGLRTSRPMGVLIGVVLTGAIAAPLVAAAPSLEVLLRDVLTTLAVPVAAWAGVFGAETMIRTRRVHSPSLLQSGGVYPAVRWVNTVMLVVASLLGWGLTSASLPSLDWQGYLWRLAGAPVPLADTDAGVAVALLVGLLTPIAVGIPALKRLQRAEYEAAADS